MCHNQADPWPQIHQDHKSIRVATCFHLVPTQRKFFSKITNRSELPLVSIWYLLQDKPWGPETSSGTGTIFMLGENVIQNTHWSMSKVAATHFNTVEVAIQIKY